MKVIKRNGTEVEFDATKIAGAITRAAKDRIPFNDIVKITDSVGDQCVSLGRAPHVEEIQNMVEDALMNFGYASVVRDYIRYRYDREKVRKGNSTDAEMLTLLDRVNEEALQENSNKDPIINSVQRDYMAGYVSKDLTERYFLPQDIVEADRQGIIHIHDKDYFAQHMHNCCLVNLKDMLQNGTVISGVMIDKPHKERIEIDRENGIKVARIYYPDCEILPTYFENYDTSKFTPLEYMAKCTEIMSKADVCFFLPCYYQSAGCRLEDHMAQVYGVKRMYLDFGVDADNLHEFVYEPIAIVREN